MKLVMEYHWCVPYEASGTTTLPFEYESAEKAICDFEDALKEAKENHNGDFIFAGTEFDSYDFTNSYENGEIRHPEFYTLDEWFEKNKIGGR